jgi:hypothetical protein
MAVLCTSAPAHAVVVLCQSPNCATTDENVLIAAQPANAVVLGTTNQTGTGVTFTSPSPINELLVGGANGQAKVTAADQLLNGLTFTIQFGKVFQTAVFNLFPLSGNNPAEAPFADISWIGPGGNSGVTTLQIAGNGNNDTGIYGTNGELFTSITFRSNPISDGISEFKQLRLGGIGNVDNPPPPPPPPPPPAVPEASTWAMMLIGFGTMGAAIRRKRARHIAMA